MSTLTLETADNRTTFHPGETLELIATWELDTPPEALELRLTWYTLGKGDSDYCIVEKVAIESPVAAGTHNASIALPHGPYSYSGKLVSIAWSVALVVLPSEDSTNLDLTIGPNRSEVVLPSETVE